jgi:hypothetical protein
MSVDSKQAVPLPNKKPRLLLNLDVNKTIVVTDPIAGTSLEQMCEVILADYAWVRVCSFMFLE